MQLGGYFGITSSRSITFDLLSSGELDLFGLLFSAKARSSWLEFEGAGSYGFIPLDHIPGLTLESFGVAVRVKLPYGVAEGRDIVCLETSNSLVSLAPAYHDGGSGPSVHFLLKMTGKIPIPTLFETIDSRRVTNFPCVESRCRNDSSYPTFSAPGRYHPMAGTLLLSFLTVGATQSHCGLTAS